MALTDLKQPISQNIFTQFTNLFSSLFNGAISNKINKVVVTNSASGIPPFALNTTSGILELQGLSILPGEYAEFIMTNDTIISGDVIDGGIYDSGDSTPSLMLIRSSLVGVDGEVTIQIRNNDSVKNVTNCKVWFNKIS